MKWYTYSQNNSGGSFDHDEERGIGQYVIIEARDTSHADARAEEIGLYFDGCREGRDCSCCGDRWYSAYDGDDRPEIYGKHIVPADDQHPPYMDWGYRSYVHPLDGAFYVAAKELSDEQAR